MCVFRHAPNLADKTLQKRLKYVDKVSVKIRVFKVINIKVRIYIFSSISRNTQFIDILAIDKASSE